MTKVKVSVIQACTEQFSKSQTLQKLEKFVTEAAAEGSKLCVFPEAFIGGYPKYSSFGAVVGLRSKEGREEYLRYWKGSILVDKQDETIQHLERISKNFKVFLTGGVIERDGGSLYCTTVFIDEKEGLIGKHRKLLPTASERLIWGQGDGSALQVIKKTFASTSMDRSSPISISSAICWENFMPLLRYHYYTQNVQIYTAPTVDSRTTWTPLMQTIAQEGRCFVLSAVQYGHKRQWDHNLISMSTPPGSSSIKLPQEEDVVIEGGSCIVNTLGEIIAGPLRGKEGVLTAEIDTEDCVRGKFDLDVSGHYARPDIFEFRAKL